MNISIFGLGYVGSVGLGCLAQNGHVVNGVDVDGDKVEVINRGESPIIEKGLGEMIAEQRRKGRISARTDGGSAVAETDVSFICVGTPSSRQGHLNLSAVFKAAEDIAAGIAKKPGFHVVAVRSTVLPGTNQKVGDIIEALTQKVRGRDFAVVSNPEFLREGTAIKDFLNPPFTLVGSDDPLAIETMKKIYQGVQAPVVVSDIRVAEIIKYVNNSYHALKISFANEIGSICKRLNLDSHAVMEVFCRDTTLNIGPAYLKPGFAYGGSCLPKDLKALCTIAHDNYLKCPVLESIDASNENKKSEVLERILQFGKNRIGFLGLSFKEGTDDLRNSPIVDILEKLLGKGFEVRIHDEKILLSRLVGANRAYILQRVPFISRFIVTDIREVLSNSEVIVVVNKDDGLEEILAGLPESVIVLDLVNIKFPGRSERKNYHGIAW
jgi:GDP-mannose 6-dehydrogenase